MISVTVTVNLNNTADRLSVDVWHSHNTL